MIESETQENLKLDWAIEYLDQKLKAEQKVIEDSLFQMKLESVSIKQLEISRENIEISTERIKMLKRSIEILRKN